LPIKLATEVRRRFAYAIDQKFSKFSPILSAATILHPKFCLLLPKDLFEAGKNEIGKWIMRIPTRDIPAPTPSIQSGPFARLSQQQARSVPTATTPWNRYF